MRWLPVALVWTNLIGCRPDPASVSGSPFSVTRVEVARAKVVERSASYFRGSGRVLPPREWDVVSRVNSPVTFTRGPGAFVRQGEVLTQFATDKLLEEKRWAEENLSRAAEGQAQAGWKQKLGQINASIKACTITAPYDLMVKSNFAVNGTLYNPGTVLLKTVETGVVRIRVRLPRWFHDFARNQSTVKVEIDGESRICRYEFEEDQVEAFLNRLGYLKLETNGTTQFSPDQTVTVSVDSGENIYGCWLPSTALNSDSQGNRFVYFVRDVGEGERPFRWVVEKMYVKLVDFDGTRVFLENEKLNGMLYVVDGMHKIVAGQSVCFEETLGSAGLDP